MGWLARGRRRNALRACGPPCTRALTLIFARSWGTPPRKPLEEDRRRLRDGVDGACELGDVGLCWLLHAGDLANVLLGSRANFLGCRWWLEVMENADITTHGLVRAGEAGTDPAWPALAGAPPGANHSSTGTGPRRWLSIQGRRPGRRPRTQAAAGGPWRRISCRQPLAWSCTLPGG